MQKEDIRLRQVIIHIMDSTMGMPVLSDQVIDFGSDFGDFLRAHIFRLLESDDMKKCSFDEDSKVQAELEALNLLYLIDEQVMGARFAQQRFQIM